MGSVPTWLRIPLVAAALAAVSFPILSVRGDGDGAVVTDAALQFGLAVTAVGYLFWGLKTAYGRTRAGVDRAAEAVTSLLGIRSVAFSLTGLIVIGAVLFPFLMPPQYVNLGFETLIYMSLALGLNVIVGYGGLLVLGYAGFWAIGAYTFSILALRLGVNMWVSLPLAGAASMLAGFLLGLPSLRLRGDYLAIVTLGFGEVVYYFLKTEVELTGGEMGLPNKDIKGSLQDHTSLFGSDPLIEPDEYYWPALALVILAVVVIRGVERSRIGRALVAMREDETAARCMGINTTRLKLSTFAFSAMWAGFAGVLWAAKVDFVNPRYFYFMESALILAMVVLGGMGSIPGVMIGSILIYAGPALLRMYSGTLQDWGIHEPQTYRLLVFGALMVLVMIYRPQGLFGSARLKAELPGKEDE
jgi:branched-chain amino acid transport system permease protein